MLAGREVPDVVEAWAHHSGSGSGLPSPTRQPLLVHFPQMIQNVNEFSISQKAIEKKSFSGGCGISKLVLVVKNLPASAGRCKTLGFDPCVGKILWRRAWQPTPVLLPGESHGQRSLVGYSAKRKT